MNKMLKSIETRRKMSESIKTAWELREVNGTSGWSDFQRSKILEGKRLAKIRRDKYGIKLTRGPLKNPKPAVEVVQKVKGKPGPKPKPVVQVVQKVKGKPGPKPKSKAKQEPQVYGIYADFDESGQVLQIYPAVYVKETEFDNGKYRTVRLLDEQFDSRYNAGGLCTKLRTAFIVGRTCLPKKNKPETRSMKAVFVDRVPSNYANRPFVFN